MGRFIRHDRDRRILRLALPALGTLAVEPLYVLVDTAIVGRIGTAELAGLGIASTVLLTVSAVIGFMEYGITPDVAFAHGQGDAHKARVAATDALWLTMLLGLPTCAIVGFGARPIVALLGGKGAVFDAAVTYLRISALGLPFVMVAYVGHGVMRGVNNLKRPLMIVLIANVINLILEIVAVWWLDLGIAGSAWSTVVVQMLAAGFFLAVLRPHLTRVRPAWVRVKPMVVTGLNLGLRGIAMLAVWITITSVAARTDTPTLAANQIAASLFMFLALGLDALAIPAQSLVAGAQGAGDIDEASAIGWSSMRLSLWCGLGLALVVAASCTVLPWVFTDEADVADRATGALLILAVMQFPGAIAFALDGALIGAEDEKYLGRAAVMNLLSFAPLAIATLIWPRLGIIGLWGAQFVWMVMRAVVNARRWSSRRWAHHQPTTAVG
jgi:putative MATE family efflux protein